MLNFSFERSQGAGILTFRGDLTSSHNEDLKSALMISLTNAERVVVNFSEVSVFDRICLQTCCTAMKIAKKLSKNLILNIFPLRNILRSGGLRKETDCSHCDRKDCPLIRSSEEMSPAS